MIKKLKNKFIMLSMLPLFVLLMTVVLSMNVVNYLSFVDDCDRTLDKIFTKESMQEPPLDSIDSPPDNMNGLGEHLFPQRDDAHDIPRDSAFFSVTFSDNGNIVRTNVELVDSVNEYEAQSYASRVFSDGNERGFVDGYRYLMRQDGKGCLVLFLDCSGQLSVITNFAISGLAVALLGYFLVFIIVIVLAERIVKPFAESYKKQKRFITDAGHEIKTPLTIISANVDLMEMENGDNEYILEIREQIKNLRDLTGSLVFLAKMEEDEKNLTMLDIPLSDIADETAASFSAPAQLEEKAIIRDIAPMLSIKGDDKSIRELVSILLDNAVKYSPRGSDITVSLVKQGKSAALTVTNKTVYDVSPGDTSLLFERFYRIDSSHNSSTGGHGIGLSIAKAIAEKHGAKISASVRSSRTLGITVMFNL